MSETLADVLSPHYRLLNEVAKSLAEKNKEANTSTNTQALPSSTHSPSTRSKRNQQRKTDNRDRRLASYETVMELLKSGLSQCEVARRCKLGVRTVRRWQRAQEFPERKTGKRKSSLDVHAEYLHQRWNEGCHNSARLWRELQKRGYMGRPGNVRVWIFRHYKYALEKSTQPNSRPPVAARASPRHVTWLILKDPEYAKTYLDELYRRSPEIAECAKLAREFGQIIRNRDMNAWDRWREEVQNSMLANFAKSLCRDESAFTAALQQPWSNGPVEGQIHRLKLIKRSMYERAKFDLLRLRVVSAA